MLSQPSSAILAPSCSGLSRTALPTISHFWAHHRPLILPTWSAFVGAWFNSDIAEFQDSRRGWPGVRACIGQQQLGRCEVMEVHARGQLEHNIHCQHHLITCGRTADLCQLHTHSLICSLTLELPESKGTAHLTSIARLTSLNHARTHTRHLIHSAMSCFTQVALTSGADQGTLREARSDAHSTRTLR